MTTSPTKDLCSFAGSLSDLPADQVKSAIYSQAHKLPFPSHFVFGKDIKKLAICKAYKVATGKELHIGL